LRDRRKIYDNPVNPGERIYRTGDVARWRPDGNVEYLGREDHYAAKIRDCESNWARFEQRDQGIRWNCRLRYRGQEYSEEVILIIAYLVCKADLDVEGLKQTPEKQLPDYMIPNHFEEIDENASDAERQSGSQGHCRIHHSDQGFHERR
jgi:hypothetical protein